MNFVRKQQCLKISLMAIAVLWLNGCSYFQHPAFVKNEQEKARFYETLRPPTHTASEGQQYQRSAAAETLIQATPTVSLDSTIMALEGGQQIPNLKGEPVSVSYNNLPLPAFINQVFGEQLSLSYALAPALQKQKDLVTLRIVQPVTPAELFKIARRTLLTYGIAINPQDGLLQFSVTKNTGGTETPLLISGRALPDVPDSQRPIFMFVPLQVVSNTKVRVWLSSVLKGKDLIVKEDPVRNAIVLQGKPHLVKQGLAIIKSLDQPHMRGKYSASIEPAYIKAAALAENLENILKSEGYDASRRPPLGSIILLPLKNSNTLVVFASTQAILAHVKEWARTIDRKQQLSIDQGIFSYEANNTQAGPIVKMLNHLASGSGASDKESQTSKQADNRGRFVVDENRNAIVYQGSGQQWLELLPVIKDMDKPASSVLVEVLLAEVTLNDSEKTGFEFVAKGTQQIGGADYNSLLSTLGGLGLGGSGLSAVLDSAGETRAILNLFYENQRAEIRSRPRLMVKSGQKATIDVGTEIPIITSNSQSASDSSAPIIQNVQYRKTGVRLTIEPIVHASGYVDIKISQELSEAQATNTSGIDSPSIFNRSLETTVTLRDGGSILLGGLISNSQSSGTVGVPWVAKIPLIGRLFRSDGESASRTELMVMVIPYVINDPLEGQQLSEAVIQSLGFE